MANLLFIGDIVGKGGRKTVKLVVPRLMNKYNCSFCIANGENLSHGSGANEKTVKDLDGVVDAITLGDHVWDQNCFEGEISYLNNVIRPANLSKKCPGVGYRIFNISKKSIAVINLLGSVFIKNSPHYCPFGIIEEVLEDVNKITNCIFVDFHAEATGEKMAMGRFLSGKVTAVMGTHTHVQSSDATIFDNHTAYISDVGMVGAVDSILGRRIDDVVYRFYYNMPRRLRVVEEGKFRLNAIIISYNPMNGIADKIIPISEYIDI